jgi:hypothetical protein
VTCREAEFLICAAQLVFSRLWHLPRQSGQRRKPFGKKFPVAGGGGQDFRQICITVNDEKNLPRKINLNVGMTRLRAAAGGWLIAAPVIPPS